VSSAAAWRLVPGERGKADRLHSRDGSNRRTKECRIADSPHLFDLGDEFVDGGCFDGELNFQSSNIVRTVAAIGDQSDGDDDMFRAVDYEEANVDRVRSVLQASVKHRGPFEGF
jgi:hypothetical protein